MSPWHEVERVAGLLLLLGGVLFFIAIVAGCADRSYYVCHQRLHEKSLSCTYNLTEEEANALEERHKRELSGVAI